LDGRVTESKKKANQYYEKIYCAIKRFFFHCQSLHRRLFFQAFKTKEERTFIRLIFFSVLCCCLLALFNTQQKQQQQHHHQ